GWPGARQGAGSGRRPPERRISGSRAGSTTVARSSATAAAPAVGSRACLFAGLELLIGAVLEAIGFRVPHDLAQDLDHFKLSDFLGAGRVGCERPLKGTDHDSNVVAAIDFP